MFCIECGAKIPDGSKFCSECGHKIVASTPSTEVKEGKADNDVLDMFEEVTTEPSASEQEIPSPAVMMQPTLESLSASTRASNVPVKEENSTTDVVKPTPVTVETTDSIAEVSIEKKLESLSTSGMLSESKTASRVLNPIDDPYWDDVLPEIENEINAIPKDNIIKVVFSIIALFAVIAWLILML